MCGFVCLWEIGDEPLAQTMIDRIAHRGPDGIEAILHLFRSGQSRWITRLDGMFSFVLATGERIIAARDPLCIKPLSMARIGAGLAFASELKAFDGVSVDAIQAIPPGGLFDSRDGPRQWYRTPHGAAGTPARQGRAHG